MSVVKTIKRGELARHAYVPPGGLTDEILCKSSDDDADLEFKETALTLDSLKLTDAERAVGATPTAFSYAPYDARRHGYTTSATTAAATNQQDELSRSTDAAVSDKDISTVTVQGGFARNTGMVFTKGVNLFGYGSSATFPFSNLIYSGDATDNLLLWNGEDAAGGGSVENFQLSATSAIGGTSTTGAALGWVATDDTLRPGDFIVRNIIVEGIEDGFGRGIYIDGAMADAAGSVGVRNITFEKVRISGCSVDNEYIRLHQVTNVVGHSVKIAQGAGSGIPGIRFTGTSAEIVINGLVVYGNCLIEDAMTDWHCEGLIEEDFTIGASTNRLTWAGHIGGNLTVTSGALRVHIFSSVDGSVTIGSGTTGCLIGALNGTVTNNSTTFLVINTNTLTPFSTRGNFTGTLTGVDAVVTNTVRWERCNNKVTLRVPTMQGTSNTTACTITGMPSSLFPDNSHTLIGRVENNGTIAFGLLTVGTDGVLTLNVGASGTAFTASGEKGHIICSYTYSTDLG